MTTASPAGFPRLLLALLGAANFTVGMGALGVIGMLGPLSGEFALSTSKAGWVVTVYALIFAVGAPLLVAASGRFARRGVVVVGLGLFALGALAAALAPGYWPLLAARVLMALGGGLVSPVVTACAVALVAPAQRARAMTIVMVGVTLSQAVGVPVSAWLAYAVGWRAGFAVNTGLALAVAAALWWRLPAGLVVPVSSLATLGQVLRSPRLLLALSYTLFFMGGAMTLYVYLPALVIGRHCASGGAVALVLQAFGLGSILGNLVGGALTPRLGPQRLLAALTLALAAMNLAVAGLELPLWGLFALVVLWSTSGWAFIVPQQARLAMLAPPLAPVLFALNASCIYVASSVGAALGPAGAVLILGAAGTLALVKRGAAAPG
jgi:predicted MFS family arabinose efflux permease